ncbi:ABC transporter substrate-binding protein [Inquilinus sp. YAF38]|uniref:ABC transporter substrate-binding protein n=1 Tax=Inquilinus sp. YAF38 TaxID=3233084 RepID=UPI003F8F2CC7
MALAAPGPLRWAAAGLLIGAAVLAASASARAETVFRFAFQGNLNTLDSYQYNETFTTATMSNVYEGLTRRDQEMKIVPALATSWEVTDDGLKWRVHLREGVKFANGDAFNADDVLYSLDRLRAPGSDIKGRVPSDMKAVKVDDNTVDFVLTKPNPLLNATWDSWPIFDKEWSTQNNAVAPSSTADKNPGYAVLHANGTGPFMVESHEIGVKTVFVRNPNWWGKPEGNIDRVEFTPIASSATRVAALLSGQVDWVDPVPVQDQDRVTNNADTTLLAAPELRTIFLGLDQDRDELLYSNIKGKNPFKDQKVRLALYQAINEDAIGQRIMRGQATPSALMISPALFSRAGEFKRHPYDPEASKKLLAEAGYPDGFEVTLDCPNDRYVNDEAICQAVVSMLARVGVKVTLNAQPRAKHFTQIGEAGGHSTSFYLLGWTPDGYDSLSVFNNLVRCRAPGVSVSNDGGYCNPKVDALVDAFSVEGDKAKRDSLIAQAYDILLNQDVGYLPLHQQALSWGVSKKFTVVQRPDNWLIFDWIKKN